MLISLALMVPIGLFIYVFAYHCDRDEARKRADEFITGIRKPTPKDIDKCMMKLEVANIRLLSRNETDHRRVEILRNIRNGKVSPHP
ncbi:hypothetical protein ES703_37915 [subsurface metagenome]